MSPHFPESPRKTEADRYMRRVLSAYIQNRSAPHDPVNESDWIRIEQVVRVHGLEGIFLHALKGVQVPPEIADRWQKRTMAVLFENLRSLRTAIELFSILDDNSIPAVAMRGLSLAHKDYVSAGMRSMGDIDILIRPEDQDGFLRACQEAGFLPEDVLRSQYIFKIDGVRFEIHWSFLTAKRYRDLIESRSMFSSRRSFTTQEGRIYCLSDENELIGLVMHSFVHHDLSVLKQLLDIAIFMVKPEMDWGYIKGWCETANLSRMFGLTLHLVSRFFMLKVEGFQRTFGELPNPRIERTLADYTNPFFGKTGMGSYLRRKSNLLYVAEHPMTKLKQLLCFFTMKEARDLFRQWVQSRAMQKPFITPQHKA